MPKLNANTVLVNPATGLPEALAAGSDVPDWATGLVGEHLLVADEKPAPKAAAAAKK